MYIPLFFIILGKRAGSFVVLSACERYGGLFKKISLKYHHNARHYAYIHHTHSQTKSFKASIEILTQRKWMPMTVLPYNFELTENNARQARASRY